MAPLHHLLLLLLLSLLLPLAGAAADQSGCLAAPAASTAGTIKCESQPLLGSTRAQLLASHCTAYSNDRHVYNINMEHVHRVCMLLIGGSLLCAFFCCAISISQFNMLAMACTLAALLFSCWCAAAPFKCAPPFSAQLVPALKRD